MEANHTVYARSGENGVQGGTGVVGAYNGGSDTVKLLIFFFAGLTIYNALELLILIFTTFKTKKGLYFWSLLTSSIGLILYALGISLKLLGVWPGQARWTGIVLLTVGWYAMVTGQSVVLWSRLHLIVSGERGRKILLYTGWMIVIDAVVLHISTSVVTFGSNGSLATREFIKAYNVIEKIQMTVFCLQEFILSIVYITETSKTLRTSLRPKTKSIMQQLIGINVLIIMMDVALLGIEYASLFLYETILKGFLYSIKLKFEFAILSRLVDAAGGREAAGRNSIATAATFFDDSDGPSVPNGGPRRNTQDVPEFVDPTKADMDYRYAAKHDTLQKRTPHQSPASSEVEAEIQQIERI